MITLPAAIITLVILFVVVGAISVILNWPIEQNETSSTSDYYYIDAGLKTNGHAGTEEDPYSLKDLADAIEREDTI